MFKTIDIGEASWISGRFRRLDNPDAEAQGYRDRTITLGEAPFPFTTFTPVATAVTDRQGYYSFKVVPQLNSRYVVSSADPAAQSEAKLIRVRIGVSVRVSARRVKRGRSVEFRGTAAPVHDGAGVLIQRRDLDGGRYKTVGRTRLVADTPARSRYRRKVKIKKSGVYRVRVSGDDNHLPGNSRSSEILVGR